MISQSKVKKPTNLRLRALEALLPDLDSNQ